MKSLNSKIVESLESKHHVEGLTHDFYRYPARFSPEFVREVIVSLSREDDVVLDTFMGGGTTVVEAVANGRKACGIDINPLSHFITKVKTTPLSTQDREAISDWLESISIVAAEDNLPLIDDTRLRNVPDSVRYFLSSGIGRLSGIRFPRQRRFARCALMKLGQWALESRRELPTWDEMKKRLTEDIENMLQGIDSLVETAGNHGIKKNSITNRRLLYLGSTDNVVSNTRKKLPKAQLVLTSPPYPGVHVLYHRWQINSRRETPAPYWLADLKDGHGESYYTLGGRSTKGQQEYFQKLSQTFYSLRTAIDENAVVVQLVAFSEPESQLPMFLDSMATAGYEELTLFGASSSDRPFRQVPNRKWYTQLGKNQSASHEILLTHRPRS